MQDPRHSLNENFNEKLEGMDDCIHVNGALSTT
jgi:hypothetical protein